jgi:23S rRNA pseudouridine1911/1915/1917 synthase
MKDFTLNVLYDDNHMIAVEKEAGLLVQKDYSNENSLMEYVKDYIKEKYSKPGNVFLGLVHRLDKPVSGCVIFAKTSKAASRLCKEFSERRIIKIYIGLVHNNGKIPNELTTISDNIRKERGKSVIAEKDDYGIKSSELSFFKQTENSKYALLAIALQTGRKHQIRMQLANFGCPIVGDEKYGSSETVPEGICLHAYYIKVKHPTKENDLEICSPIPKRILDKINYTDINLQNILDIFT